MRKTSSKAKRINSFMLLIGVMVLIKASDSQIQQSCLALDSPFNNQHTQACKSNYQANKNWFAWITGGSLSPHFHFLDLVELLHSKP